GGKIVAVNRDELVLSTGAGERRIPTDKIKRICSPRVYSFVMPVVAGEKIDLSKTFQANANNIKFEKTTKKCSDKEKKAAAAQGRHPRSCCPGFMAMVPAKPQAATGKIVLITAALLAIAAAIAIPIAVAVPLSNRKKPPPPFIP